MKLSAKKIGNFIFVIIVFIATFCAVFHGEDLCTMIFYLKTVNIAYLVPAVFCVIFFILGESLVISYLMRSLGTEISFSHCCLYSFIGFFYSCITPSASGGQPMQIVAMRKDRIPVAVSTVVLAIVTITYKLVLVLIGAGVLLLRPPMLVPFLEPVKEWILLGFFLNIICISVLLLLVFGTNAVQRMLKMVFFLMNHIHTPKHPEKQAEIIENITSQYRGTAAYYRTHKKIIVHVFLITLLQRCLLFLITWFVYRAFGLSDCSLPLIITLQAMISVAADMLPLPGGMGISETLFLKIFLPVFGDTLLLPAMILSRGIGYYTQLIMSAAMTIVASFVIKNKNSQKERVLP